ncbi:MAG: SDR family NAD(P)-dependent oxidoreductase [Anaerolineae bacterium]|nr:SDR family NAD(P)-dependent oxidoreductase [Anaerolineae bacterium]
MAQQWTEHDIPDQTGSVAIVTGANSGIGWDTARALAQKGATVIMACRSMKKADMAADKIRTLNPSGSVTIMALDLGDLDSVRSFAAAFRAQYDRLDLLINNAGVMIPPYGKTVQGFEQQFGVNHLGHFALTGLLLDMLNATPGARVVTVSSGAHQFGVINFEDLNWEKGYPAQRAYGQSKLANLLFTYELQRKLNAAGQGTLAVASHPGWTATNLQQHSGLFEVLNPLFAQTTDMGALPTLYAATAQDVHGGEYFGPGGFMEMRGYPKKVNSNARSHDEAVARRLWQVSEDLTQVTFMLEPAMVG